ncbi:MAG: FAD-dependent oxidoreductase, partial [Bacteroidia bacterium]
IVIFEKGEYISYANCGLPYYIGNVIKNRNSLFVQTAASFNKRFNIDVRTLTEVVSIHAEEKYIIAKNQVDGKEYKESFDKLVLSPGAEPIRPALPGILNEGIFTLRNVADTDYIKSYVQEKTTRRAVVIGAGFIGLEMAENLHELGIEVSIIEMGNQILAPLDFEMAAITQQHIRSKGVQLHLNSMVTGFEKSDAGLLVLLKDQEAIPADLVIMSIGVKPDTRLAQMAGLKIGPAKGIWVNEYLQTSDPDIYAVGDAIEFENPISNQSMNTYLAGPANKQGRLVANNIVQGNTHSYKGAINTAIVKVFDLTVASAGMASKNLNRVGIQHVVSTTHNGSHAGYYPGAKQMSIQLSFDANNGRLYGAQIVGYDGVDKRIDVLSSVIQRAGNIEELVEFEHAYAPPFSSAKDPVNMAGFVAENIILKKHEIFHWNEIEQLPEDAVLIDVRTILEYENGHIPGAIHIPVDDLRSRIHEINPTQQIYLYCQGGLRGYLAQQILKQNGIHSSLNLSGGYQVWNTCMLEKKVYKEMELFA